MPPRSNELRKTAFAVEIDGRTKAEFNTREGVENGAIELKRRFPALRIRLYDAETQSRHEVQARVAINAIICPTSIRYLRAGMSIEQTVTWFIV